MKIKTLYTIQNILISFIRILAMLYIDFVIYIPSLNILGKILVIGICIITPRLLNPES